MRLILALCTASLLLVHVAHAQEPALIEPTPEQASLRELAFKAFADGDMETAIVMFERSLSIRELNTTWANLGRARWKSGDCAGAVAAFDKAQSGPGDASVAEITETLRRYRAQLPETCGQLLLSCSEPVDVTIDGAPARPCDAQTVWVTVGEHEIVAVFGPGPVSRTVNVEGGFVREVILSAPEPQPVVAVAPPAQVTPDEVAPPPEVERSSATQIFGWASAGVGVAALGTVLALDATWTSPRYDRLESNEDPARDEGLRRSFEDAQTINQALFYTGAGLVAVGAGLLIADALSGDEGGAAVAPFVGPDRAGVVVRF